MFGGWGGEKGVGGGGLEGSGKGSGKVMEDVLEFVEDICR
jgi:hypothetical protein